MQKLRSPTLDTVQMVEETIKRTKEDHTRRSLWKALPRQVMWQTYLVVLAYLESILHIGFDRDGVIVYMHQPELMTKYKGRKDLDWRTVLEGDVRKRTAKK